MASAGGSWQTQNKVRPGAYINFSNVETPLINVGDRGIATVAIEMSWGAEGELIDVYSSDLTDGTSRKKIGYTATDKEESLIARAMLSNCYMVKFYNLNSGGAKATKKDDTSTLTATAKYNGTAGNKITIQVTKSKINESKYTVTTLWDGLKVDIQTVTALEEIADNDYVTFTHEEGSIAEIAGMPLEGGTDGTYSKSNYDNYFNLLKTAKWQCMAIIKDGSNINATAQEFIQQMRDDEGRKVQCCLYDTTAGKYDYEGIIRSEQGLKNVADGEELTAEQVPALVCGLTAGASITQSNTHKALTDFYVDTIVPEYTNNEIIEKLGEGAFLFSSRDDGTVQVEKDINTFRTYTPTKSYPFSKNKVIRVIDEMNQSIKDTWDVSYCGKVGNSATGRDIFKGDIISYIKKLQNMGAVDTVLKDGSAYDLVSNITVTRGENIDAVVTNIYNLPVVDNMEILYCDVVIQS